MLRWGGSWARELCNSDGSGVERVDVMYCECLPDCDVLTASAGGLMRGALLSLEKARLEARDLRLSVPPTWHSPAYQYLLSEASVRTG